MVANRPSIRKRHQFPLLFPVVGKTLRSIIYQNVTENLCRLDRMKDSTTIAHSTQLNSTHAVCQIVTVHAKHRVDDSERRRRIELKTQLP